MSVAEKFMFDVPFDDLTESPEAQEAPQENETEAMEPEEIVPTFSEEEVELARQQGYETGKEEGLAATTETLTKQINETLIRVDERLTAAFATQDAANEELSRAALSVAMGICRKMLPGLAERHSFGEVERVIEDVFSKAVEEPNVTITVHSDIAGQIEERVNELASGKGYQGRVVLQADETMEPSDCKIEWANGGSERNSHALWRDITGIIDRNLGGHPTIWDEPEELEEPAVTDSSDLLAPEALVSPAEPQLEPESPSAPEQGDVMEDAPGDSKPEVTAEDAVKEPSMETEQSETEEPAEDEPSGSPEQPNIDD